MKWHLFAVLALFALGSGIPATARAQYVMDWNAGNSLIMSSVQNDNYNRERARADAELAKEWQGSQRQRSTPRAKPSRPMIDQTFDAAFAQLGDEFQRRTAAYCKPAATDWLVATMKSLGTELGAMAPEYRRRVRSDGQRSADLWYLDRARSAGRRHAGDDTGR